jgi:hypothetical protein
MEATASPICASGSCWKPREGGFAQIKLISPDFYALFPRWEEELCSWERARETLEKAVSEQAHRPEEILYFRSHWDLLTLLQGILRLRPFLTLICPPGRGMSSPQEDRTAPRSPRTPVSP